MEPGQEIKTITKEEILEAAKLFPREEFQARLRQELGLDDLVINFTEKTPYGGSVTGLIWESNPINSEEFGILGLAITSLAVSGFSGFQFFSNQSQKDKARCSSQITFQYDQVNGRSNCIAIGDVTGIFENGKWNLTYKMKF